MSDAAEVKRQLQMRVLDVCQYLVPGGRKRGHEYSAASIGGGKGESFRVHLSGEKAGQWAEFNGGDQKGDVFGLIQAVRGCTFVEALDWARDYLGLESPSFHRPAPARSYRRAERPADAVKPRAGGVLGYLTNTRRLTAAAVEAYQFGEAAYPAWAREESVRGSLAVVMPYKRAGAGELAMVKWLALDRPDGKKAVTTTKDAEPCLFGWQAIPDAARTVVIAEGEIDAATWWQMGYPALAPPRGTGSTDWVDVEYPNLERFEAVYLAFDNDDAGRACLAKVAPRFGDRARIVGHLDAARFGKDANAWLQAGATRADFARLVETARDCGPDELRSPAEFEDAVLERFYPTGETATGPEPPFGKIAGRVRFRPSELSVWTGFNFHGKSTMLKYLMLSAGFQGERSCLAMLEEMPEVTIEHLVRQATGERTPRPERVVSTLAWLADRFVIWDHRKGSVKIERAVEVFAYARRRYACSQVVLDNLAMLGIGEDDYNRQKDAMVQLLDLARTTGAHVHLVAHPRKGADESEPPGKLDVRGGAALTDLAHNVFCHWKNVAKAERLAELEAETDPANEIPGIVAGEPDALWAVRKQRETGDTPIVKLWFHRGSLQFHEQPGQRPFCFADTPRALENFSHAETDRIDEPPVAQWEDDGDDLPF